MPNAAWRDCAIRVEGATSKEHNSQHNEGLTNSSQAFQVLLLDGKNVGPKAFRDAREMVISKEQFQAVLKRHEAQACPRARRRDGEFIPPSR